MAIRHEDRPALNPRAFLNFRTLLSPSHAPSHSGDYFVGEWRSKQKTKYLRLQSSKFQEAASSEREIEGFPAMAECFRVIITREEIESYPLLQVYSSDLVSGVVQRFRYCLEVCIRSLAAQ